MNFDSGTQPSGCRTIGTSTHCSLKAAFLSPTRFLRTMRGLKLWKLCMNFVAADVRRLILSASTEIRASLRRLLQFKAPMRGLKLWKLSMNIEAADVSPLQLKFRKVRADSRRLLRFRGSRRGRHDSHSLTQREWIGVRVCFDRVLAP